MGPCLCGDTYCPSCGNPYAAELEAASEWAGEALFKAKLTPDEYRIVVSVGLAAVHHARKAAKAQLADYQAAEEEAGAEFGNFDNQFN